MRLQINLTKDEALAYKNFADVCKPLEISDSDFMKTIFLTGIESMNKELAEVFLGPRILRGVKNVAELLS